MTTALQQQLAAIAANSTHQLDLKAQRQRHSKSLLFEPREAATQSFDELYQICYEGFEELCMLDARFSQFNRSLFSEQSRNEDRTQMTARENEELDKILESFLGLVCGRLLLKPAMKAMEWVVRRFRVQEYNTESTLLTFLPYHTSHVFPTLLSILPDRLPPSFKFLHPYVASLQSPPRHAILQAAISNQTFFSAMNRYVLNVAKARHHSTVLLGFWASITAQSVNGMIDNSRSGRDDIRRQREEDLLLRILPVLQSALSIKGVPELYLGVCMIVTILATKASLGDNVLDAMMEAVAASWTSEVLVEGLTCLAVLAEEKQEIAQPASVTKALLKAEDAVRRLIKLGGSQRVGNLAAATAAGVLTHGSKRSDASDIALVQSIIDSDTVPEQHVVAILEQALSSLNEQDTDPSNEAHEALIKFLTGYAEDQAGIQKLQQAAKRANVTMDALRLPLSTTSVTELEDEPEPVHAGSMDVDVEQDAGEGDLGLLLESLPAIPDQRTSFLEPGMDETFKQYYDAFRTTLPSAPRMEAFLQLPQMHRSQSIEYPQLLSFLMRIWSNNSAFSEEVRAIEVVTEQLHRARQDAGIDTQALLPYLIVALADANARVRRSAARTCQYMLDCYGSGGGKGSRPRVPTNVYGANASKSHWLTSEDAYKFLRNGFLPILEDAVLDAEYILRALPGILNDGSLGSAQQSNAAEKRELKKSLRSDICSFLAMHVTSAPVMRVKLRLLQILNKVGKSAAQARSSLLTPFVRDWINLHADDIIKNCSNEAVDVQELDRAVLGCLTHRSVAEVNLLKDTTRGGSLQRPGVQSLAFERLQLLFPLLKTSQPELVAFLLELCLLNATNQTDQTAQERALETLRSLHLPTEVLVHLLETLPSVSAMTDQPSSPKRQRRSSNTGPQSREANPEKLQSALRQVTLVLELVEASKPEQHPKLLKGLFHLLSEMHHFKLFMGSELVYVQNLLLGCLSSVVEGLRKQSNPDVDRSHIRTDLIVECVRTTSSKQIHNTALLLVSSLATWAPEMVLHSVMPLFTFMSSTLLRQSDDFSAHVADQTVARIVPALAASLKKQGKSLLGGVSELLLSFAAAFEHIPLHRRSDVFEHLVDTLGANETLFAIIAMLIDRYPDEPSMQGFIASLVNHFSPLSALQAATQYLDLVSDGLNAKRTLSDTLLGFSDKNESEREDSIEVLLHGLSTLLENSPLRKRLANELRKSGQEPDQIRSKYSTLLEKTMILSRNFATSETLSDQAKSTLLAVLGLMPTADFFESSAQLMQTGSDKTRQQVFRSLEARVARAKPKDAESRQVFVDALQNCGLFIDEDQPVATRHAAISCIDQIAEKYGKADRNAVHEVAKRMSGAAALGSNDPSLQVISTLCIASMIEILGDDIIPILPAIITRVLAILSSDLQDDSSDAELQGASFTLLSAVLDQLPWLLSGHSLEQALTYAAMAASGEGQVEAILAVVKDFKSLTARKVDASQLFTAVECTWNAVQETSDAAVHYHLSVFHAAVQHHSKATLTKSSQVLFSVLLKAFDLRRQHFQHSDSPDEARELHDFVDSIALDVTLKLNDVTFRPFFIRFAEWAAKGLPTPDTEGRTLRKISLFSFSLALFEQLKSIVTNYASFLLDEASAELLKPLSDNPRDLDLLSIALQTLSSSFRHDQDDFWQSPSHFDAVAMPLIGKLELTQSLQVTEHIVPTITDLAAAAASPELHKTMNAKIMSYMRHEHASVRLVAVKCERSITERINFDWLALLPEMLPFISELQEDDDENVERETLRWVKQIEDVTGENLEAMLA